MYGRIFLGVSSGFVKGSVRIVDELVRKVGWLVSDGFEAECQPSCS